MEKSLRGGLKLMERKLWTENGPQKVLNQGLKYWTLAHRNCLVTYQTVAIDGALQDSAGCKFVLYFPH